MLRCARRGLLSLRVAVWVFGCILISAYSARWLEESAPQPPGDIPFVQRRIKGRSFVVSPNRRWFLKDGSPFSFISGGMPYFQFPKALWRDRLLKMKEAGFNAVQTSVEWRGHEPQEGMYNFDEEYDLTDFLRLAQEVGLLVILRPGPHVNPERDNGGLPYWLLRHDGAMMTGNLSRFHSRAVDTWLSVLLPIVEPFLYHNGGPIIMVQVENAYGNNAACDLSYMNHWVDTFRRHLGRRIVLFRTSTQDAKLEGCDSFDRTLVSVDADCTLNVSRLLKKFQRSGPLVVSEYYTDLYDRNEELVRVDCRAARLRELRRLLQIGASVNIHKFHENPNYGPADVDVPSHFSEYYESGAMFYGHGDPTPLYSQLLSAVFNKSTEASALGRSPRLCLGTIPLSCSNPLESVIEHSTTTVYAEYPLSFEDLKQDLGYVLYRTKVDFPLKNRSLLSVPGIKDAGFLYNGYSVAVVTPKCPSVTVGAVKGTELTIVVESSGRRYYGADVDRKGILSNVTLNGKVLTNWKINAIPITSSDGMAHLQSQIKPSERCRYPGFLNGRFRLAKHQTPLDAFLDLSTWSRGIAIINGFSLGRYSQRTTERLSGPPRWPPDLLQRRVVLYVPKFILRPYPQDNIVVLLELKGPRANDKTVSIIDDPY